MKRLIKCVAILALLGYVGILAFDGNFIGLAFWLLELFMVILEEALDRKEEKQAFKNAADKNLVGYVSKDFNDNIIKIELESDFSKDDFIAYYRGVIRWLEHKNHNLTYKH